MILVCRRRAPALITTEAIRARQLYVGSTIARGNRRLRQGAQQGSKPFVWTKTKRRRDCAGTSPIPSASREGTYRPGGTQTASEFFPGSIGPLAWCGAGPDLVDLYCGVRGLVRGTSI